MQDYRAIVKQALAAQGVTQSQLARDAGYSRPHIVAWLNGRKEISAATLAKIASVLGLELKHTR